jgi:circadian clock protein KaiC
MTDRMSSGSKRLDAVLGGGLPRNGIVLIGGNPGSGKTILAQQYVFHNASSSSPALYLSTVSEPLEKILRYSQSLDFFDSAALGSQVIYADLGDVLNELGLAGASTRLAELLKQHRPGLLVIDSFRALQTYAADPETFRSFLHEVASRLSALPVTSFWVGEYTSTETSDAPEFAVADAILSMETERQADRDRRVLSVIKLRGSSSLSGKHAYRISSAGIDVFPRMADPVEREHYGGTHERMSSGVPPLDAMLYDGFHRGSSTLLAGPSGIGKTLLALHFVYAGAQSGETGLIATFQENPTQLERIANGFAWSLRDPGIELMYRTPVDLYLDQWVYELLENVERTGASRVAIDSLGDLRAAAGDELRFREYTYSLLQRFARANVTVMMTQEVGELFGITRLSEYSISHLSDNVILLQFLREESALSRALTILKARGSAHDHNTREYRITGQGIVLGDPIDPVDREESRTRR